jgi:hypothetical protein
MTAPTPDADQLHDVRILRLPIPVFVRAQEHGAELLREMYLLAQQLDDADRHHLPARLTALVDSLGHRFAGLTTEQDVLLEAAVAADVAEIDLLYRLPAAAAAAVQALGDLLDEADEFCRQGRHLLTLATPDESLRYRRWYLGEFTRQLGGEDPIAWPDFVQP